MIPAYTSPGTYVMCIDAGQSELVKGRRYRVACIEVERAPGLPDALRIYLADAPVRYRPFSASRFKIATLPQELTRWLHPKPYGERHDPA